MNSKSKDTSKQNKENRQPKGKKLTAAQRRQLEREQRRNASIDDPLAAFDTTGGYRKSEPEDIGSIAGLSGFSLEDDYYSRIYGDFANEPEVRPERKRPEPPEDEGEIKPASPLTRRQRHIRMIASYISVFFIIVIAAVVLSLTVMFKTTEIKVEAEGLPYSDEQVIEASGLSMSDNIFLAKRKAAEKKLVESFPYVEAADVSFRIPGTQIITIETAIPSYQVQFSGGYAVVSGNCRILEVNEKQKNEIPLLKGIKLDHTQPGEYITFEKASTKQILDEVVKNINENDVGNIYGIDISNAANIELNYDNRITILLGLPEDVGYKLRTAKAIINGSLAANDKGTLDVSLANSERRSSYFTPIYSDTASLPEGGASSRSEQIGQSSKPSESEEYYLEDIIE